MEPASLPILSQPLLPLRRIKDIKEVLTSSKAFPIILRLLFQVSGMAQANLRFQLLLMGVDLHLERREEVRDSTHPL